MNVGTRVKLSSAMVKAACKGNAEGNKYHCRIMTGVCGTVTSITDHFVVVRWDSVWDYDTYYNADQIEAVQ
jgi:hypothetical protein